MNNTRRRANANEANWNAARNIAGPAVRTNGVNGGRVNYLESAFGPQGSSLDPTYTNVTLQGRPEVPVLNKNLARRSHYIERNVVPSPYVKIHPDKPSPFSANLQINKTHKGTVFGSTPENVLNRYKFQKGFFAKELAGKQYNLRQMNLEDAKHSASLQQEINSANSLRKIHEREIDEAIQRAKNSAARSLSTKEAAEIKRKKLQAEQMHKRAELFPAPKTPYPTPAPAPAPAPAPPKKTFWQRMTGRGRNTRKNRKSRSRKSRRN